MKSLTDVAPRALQTLQGKFPTGAALDRKMTRAELVDVAVDVLLEIPVEVAPIACDWLVRVYRAALAMCQPHLGDDELDANAFRYLHAIEARIAALSSAEGKA